MEKIKYWMRVSQAAVVIPTVFLWSWVAPKNFNLFLDYMHGNRDLW